MPLQAERYPEAIDQLDTYVELLATLGVERGLIGPREADRLWGTGTSSTVRQSRTILLTTFHTGDCR